MSKGHGRAQRWVLAALRGDERPTWDRWVAVVDLGARYADEVGLPHGRGAEESIRRAVKRLAGEGELEADRWFVMRPSFNERWGVEVEKERAVLSCRVPLTCEEERAERIHFLEERWRGRPTTSASCGSPPMSSEQAGQEPVRHSPMSLQDEEPPCARAS